MRRRAYVDRVPRVYGWPSTIRRLLERLEELDERKASVGLRPDRRGWQVAMTTREGLTYVIASGRTARGAIRKAIAHVERWR